MVACSNRPLQGQYGKDIEFDLRREIPQLVQCQVSQVAALIHAGAHGACHGFVGIAKRQALLDQVVCQVGRRGISLQGRGAHCLRLDRDAASHVGKDAQGIDHGVDGVEKRLLVFLVILVVGQWLTLHQGQQRDQVPVDTAGLAACKFGHVRVFLLRHDR